MVLFSAGGENLSLMIKQSIRIGFAFVLMLAFSHISPRTLSRWSPYIYAMGLALLFVVLGFGIVGKGAQRWLDLGLFRFQPAEIMKLAVPMMVAWILTRTILPPKAGYLILAIIVVLLPTVLVVMQPDLGTAILIAATGIIVIFLAGISWKLILSVCVLVGAAAPALWVFVLHEYQRLPPMKKNPYAPEVP